jgi:hypothetical protein
MKRSSTQFVIAKIFGTVLVTLLFAFASCSNPLSEGAVGGGGNSALSQVATNIPRAPLPISDDPSFQAFVTAVLGDPSTEGILENDVTVTPAFAPIGTATVPCTGTFDGSGYTLTVKITGTTSYVGIFGVNNGVIQNLFVDGTVTATVPTGGSEVNYVVGVVAYNDIEGTIQNVISSVTVTAIDDNIRAIGGIAGFNGWDEYTPDSRHYNIAYQTGGVIRQCRNIGTVSGGNSKIGGIAGENAWQITECSNWGAISCTKTIDGWPGVGGIAGRNGNNNTATEQGHILECYNWGEVSDDTTASTSHNAYGGITGWCNNTSDVYNCYTAGQFNVASGQKNPIMACVDSTRDRGDYNYSLETIYAYDNDIVLTGVRKSSAYMQTQPFADDLNTAAPNSPYVFWTGYAYPVLKWETSNL